MKYMGTSRLSRIATNSSWSGKVKLLLELFVICGALLKVATIWYLLLIKDYFSKSLTLRQSY